MELVHLLFIALGTLLGILLLGFWIWMLVDCATKEPSEGYDKLVWLIVIVATKFVGAGIYYFFRRPQRMRLSAG